MAPPPRWKYSCGRRRRRRRRGASVGVAASSPSAGSELAGGVPAVSPEGAGVGVGGDASGGASPGPAGDGTGAGGAGAGGGGRGAGGAATGGVGSAGTGDVSSDSCVTRSDRKFSARKRLRSAGYAAVAAEFQVPSSCCRPPAPAACEPGACEHARFPSGCMQSERPGVNQKVVYFWVSAPNMHCAKVADCRAQAERSASMCGSSHIGPWSATWKSQG